MQYKKTSIIRNDRVSSNIFRMTVHEEQAANIVPGQFYLVKLVDKSPLLARPLSIYRVDQQTVSFLYAVVGEGTDKLSRLQVDDQLYITGPLGNGFDIAKLSGKVAMVSGSVGVAPFIELKRRLQAKQITLYAGFSSEPYGLDEFSDIDQIIVATDDGSYGHHGFITDCFQPELFDVVVTCGPEALMQKVIAACSAVSVPVFASMDKRMACGIGACLVCSCKTVAGYKRCCVDGPVFSGQELELEADGDA